MPDGVLAAASLPTATPPLSPSAYSTLLACGLRYAWEEVREPQRLPGSPSARLGSVVHDLYMHAGRGKIDPTEMAIKTAWREVLDRVEGRMRQSWLEQPFLPLRSRVRHYEETRQAAVRHALALAVRAASRPKGTASGGLPPEAGLTSKDGTMAGRIDVALWTPEGTVIRDYKTGAVYEEVEDGGQDVKIAYQFQLKLYAALHADARGKWPVRLELMTIAGDIVEIPFTRDECEQLFAEAKGRVADLWSRVEDVRSGQRGIEAITSPGDACKWCRYRPVCPAYQPWAESQPREATGRRDTWGTVGRVGTTRRGLAAVELDTNAGPVQVLDLNPSPARNPALTHISEGDPLAVFDVIPVNEQSLRAIDQTVVYRA